MSWNWAYSKRKQKEMAKKSSSYQQGVEGVKPLYKTFSYNKPQHNSHEYIQEQQRQHRVNVISIVIITLECITGISVISYFIVYGT
tara:strand:+ start:73 stop:330 length:258 start_codon:yes stop_codon:yes gene_type:complete